MLEGVGDEVVEALHCLVPVLWLLEVCQLLTKFAPPLVQCMVCGVNVDK